MDSGFIAVGSIVIAVARCKMEAARDLLVKKNIADADLNMLSSYDVIISDIKGVGKDFNHFISSSKNTSLF